MDSHDAKQAHVNLSWWITSLATSVVCCSILFVWFSSYIYQIKEELAVARVRFDITESRLNEMSIELQMLNHRTTVQQIQIVPNGSAPTSEMRTPETPAPPAMPVPVPEKH